MEACDGSNDLEPHAAAPYVKYGCAAPKTWTREEYRRLAEAGIIASDEKLNSSTARSCTKMTHNPPHAVPHSLPTMARDYHPLGAASEDSVAIGFPSSVSGTGLSSGTGTPQLYSQPIQSQVQIELVVEVWTLA